MSTGHSSGAFVSKRSFGVSERNYSGLRTICDECASRIDNIKGVKFLLTVGLIIILWLIGTCNEDSHKSSTRDDITKESLQNPSDIKDKVIAKNGLKMRTAPNSKSSIVTTIQIDEEIKIIDDKEPQEVFNGIVANWYKVEYFGLTGWVWGGFVAIKN